MQRFKFVTLMALVVEGGLLACQPASRVLQASSASSMSSGATGTSAAVSSPGTLAGPPLPLWSVPALAAPLTMVEAPFSSMGHGGGRYTMGLWVSDRNAYEAKTPVPTAFVACAEHREGPVTAAGDLITCMRKGPAATGIEGPWQYGVTRRGGATWLRVGSLSDCERCHSTAMRDHLFGVP